MRSRALLIQRLFIAGAIAIAFSGCATTQTFNAPGVSRPDRNEVYVVRMPVDIELSSLTATGLQEPRADWTQAAQQHVEQQLGRQLHLKGTRIVKYQEPSDSEKLRTHTQLQKLHERVGSAILTHKVNMPNTGAPLVPLPTLDDRFDYTLGEDANTLARDMNAQYALFVFLRDSYSTGGRKALMILAAAGGTVLSGGQQYGFASLVDLKDGNVVWFNFLHQSTGDLRKADNAKRAISKLLKDFPL